MYRLVADPLRIKRAGRSNWQKWEHAKETLETAKKQY